MTEIVDDLIPPNIIECAVTDNCTSTMRERHERKREDGGGDNNLTVWISSCMSDPWPRDGLDHDVIWRPFPNTNDSAAFHPHAENQATPTSASVSPLCPAERENFCIPCR